MDMNIPVSCLLSDNYGTLILIVEGLCFQIWKFCLLFLIFDVKIGTNKGIQVENIICKKITNQVRYYILYHQYAWYIEFK